MSEPFDEDDEDLVADLAEVIAQSKLDCRDWSYETRLELARELVVAMKAMDPWTKP